jgi:hypothetical protein
MRTAALSSFAGDDESKVGKRPLFCLLPFYFCLITILVANQTQKILSTVWRVTNMAENENAAPAAEDTGEAAQQQQAAPAEEITYHAVEKDGQVTAIWEMQGRKHLRTIDPRSRQGQEILRLYTAEHGE